MMTDADRARFMAKVRRCGNGCWLWKRCRTEKGYGRFWCNGAAHRAHRIALEDKIGRKLGPSEFVLHDCPGGDNPRCVNPAHMLVGTHAENMHDMCKKGRAGKRVKGRKVTADAVRRAVAVAAERGRAAACEETGLTRRALRDILSGRYWSRVTGIGVNNEDVRPKDLG